MCVSTYTIQEPKLTLLVNRRQKKRLPATVLAFKLFPTHRSYLVYYYYSCGVQDYVNVVYSLSQAGSTSLMVQILSVCT